nr:hypothetical protein [Tanacetum cinerariifolium]
MFSLPERLKADSPAFKIYNLRTRKVEENLHIRFMEDKPSIAGTKESLGVGHSSMEKGSSQDYTLMPLWKDGLLFDSFSKNASNDEPQSSSDAGQKHDKVSNKESKATNKLNYAFKNLSTEYTDDLNMLGLETIATNDDSEEEADFTNLESSIQ